MLTRDTYKVFLSCMMILDLCLSLDYGLLYVFTLLLLFIYFFLCAIHLMVYSTVTRSSHVILLLMHILWVKYCLPFEMPIGVLICMLSEVQRKIYIFAILGSIRPSTIDHYSAYN